MKSVLNKISSAKRDGGVVLAGGKRLLFPGKLKGGILLNQQ